MRSRRLRAIGAEHCSVRRYALGMNRHSTPKEFFMSFRNNLFIAAAVAATLGVSSPVIAGDPSSLVLDSCTRSFAMDRAAGHPGKSIAVPKRTGAVAQQCAVDKRKPLILASYLDARGGLALVRGRTERALEQIHARKSGPVSAAELTNQCVAYTVLRQWPEAGDACDAAVEGALLQREQANKLHYWDRKRADAVTAAAYSNRAVMHWLSGDESAAQENLSSARRLSPNAAYVKRNLELAERGSALASAAAIASSGS
jgi:hypothetical protein